MEVVPLWQIRGEPRKARSAEEVLEGVQLVLATPHLLFQQLADVGRHAEVGLGRLDTQPIGNVLAQGECEILHGLGPFALCFAGSAKLHALVMEH
jgi:hypothetical protein